MQCRHGRRGRRFAVENAGRGAKTCRWERGARRRAVTGRGAGKERRWLVSAQLATDVKKKKEGQRRERASHRLVTRGRGV